MHVNRIRAQMIGSIIIIAEAFQIQCIDRMCFQLRTEISEFEKKKKKEKKKRKMKTIHPIE